MARKTATPPAAPRIFDRGAAELVIDVAAAADDRASSPATSVADEHPTHLVVTVGQRATLALSEPGDQRAHLRLLAFGPGYRERWPAEALQHAVYAGVVADVRDRDIHTALHEVVPFVRMRLSEPPLVALLVPPELGDEWTLARLSVLARGLHAPVVRSAVGSRPSPWDLATFVGQSLVQHGLVCYTLDDAALVLRPPCAGTVFRWNDVWSTGPDDLVASLSRSSVRSVLIFVRSRPDVSLRRIDEVIIEVQALVRAETDVVCAAAADASLSDDVIVAVMEGA